MRGVACVCLSLVLLFLIAPFVNQSVANARSRRYYRTIWEYAHLHGDLPELGATSSPNSSDWANSVAICATMKEENSTDVREWLLYHQWLGVDHVYLSENAASPTSTIRSQLDDFVRSGFVTYATEPMPRSQLKVYYDCMSRHYTKHNWLAFIDIDEFIVLMDRNNQQTLPEFMDAYRQQVGLSVHWVLVGPSGRKARPPAGGVLRHYHRCAGEARHMVKTIANTFYLSNIASHPHNFEFRGGKASVDEQMRPVPHQNSIMCRPQDGETGSRAARAGEAPQAPCHLDAGFQRSQATAAKIGIFHYTTKSRQDFEVKVHRGSAMRETGKPWSFFDQIDKMTQKSGGICDIPASYAAECCPSEALVLQT